MKPLEIALDELLAAGPEIHCGDSIAALWRLHDCLGAILEHLDPELIGVDLAAERKRATLAGQGRKQTPLAVAPKVW